MYRILESKVAGFLVIRLLINVPFVQANLQMLEKESENPPNCLNKLISCVIYLMHLAFYDNQSSCFCLFASFPFIIQKLQASFYIFFQVIKKSEFFFILRQNVHFPPTINLASGLEGPAIMCSVIIQCNPVGLEEQKIYHCVIPFNLLKPLGNIVLLRIPKVQICQVNFFISDFIILKLSDLVFILRKRNIICPSIMYVYAHVSFMSMPKYHVCLCPSIIYVYAQVSCMSMSKYHVCLCLSIMYVYV